MKDWTSPVYVFFEPQPRVVVVDKRRAHEFRCCVHGCKLTIRRFLDTGDACSTGNMRKHIKSCWGPEVLAATDDAKDANEVCTKIVGSVL